MIRRPPRSTQSRSSAASDVYKRQELTVALAREMLALAGRPDADVPAALADGRAMDIWRAMISAQGGDPDAALPVARATHVVTAPRSGVLVQQDALPFGIAAWRLGAGRARKQDPVQLSL